MVTASLPVLLLFSVGVVLLGTRLLQHVQRTVFKVLPFGAVAELNLLDVCIGILITGSYYLYFRTFAVLGPATASGLCAWKIRAMASGLCYSGRPQEVGCAVGLCYFQWAVLLSVGRAFALVGWLMVMSGCK